jgi:hypothetical protein
MVQAGKTICTGVGEWHYSGCRKINENTKSYRVCQLALQEQRPSCIIAASAGHEPLHNVAITFFAKASDMHRGELFPVFCCQ